MSTTSVIERKKERESPPKKVIRSEVNFLSFPFFALYRQDIWKRTEAEYKTMQRRGDAKLEIIWNVSANQKFGYPGPFDRKLHKAIEELLSNVKPPIQNPICLGSLYSLAKLMDVAPSGRIWRQIKLGLQRITVTAIVSKGTFYSKEKKSYIEDTFHLYDRVVYMGEQLPDGEIADTNYLFLGSWYLQNINARYVRPLDFTFYKKLKGNIAPRFYELLGVKFYGLPAGEFIHYKYSTLCQLLPLTRQKYLSLAKQVLNPAHEELRRKGFLAGYRWSKGKGNDWHVFYWPGWKAREEIEGSTLEQLPPAEWLQGRPADEEVQAELIPASPTPKLDEIWRKVLGDLEQELSRANFKTWVKDSILLTLEENRALVGVCNPSAKRYLESPLGSEVRKAMMNVLGREIALEFVVVIRGAAGVYATN